MSRGGQELIRGEGPVLWLYSSFLAPSLGSNRSPDVFYRQLLKAGRLFGAFRRGVEHRDSPPGFAKRWYRPNVQLIALSAVQLFQLKLSRFSLT